MKYNLCKPKRSTRYNHGYPTNKTEDYAAFISLCVDDSQIIKTVAADYKYCFTKCRPKTPELITIMKSCGITLDNLYSKLKQKDHIDCLIVPDRSTTSTKINEAIKWGVRIITIDEFYQLLVQLYEKNK